MAATKVKIIGDLAHRLIFRSSNTMVGKIIHTFANTVYIKTYDDNLICITSYEIMAPMNVVISREFNFATLNHDQEEDDNNFQQLYCERDGFRIHNIHFDSSKSSIYYGKAAESFQTSYELGEQALVAARMLSKVNKKHSILDPKSPFHDGLLSAVTKITYAAGSKCFGAIQDAIPSIVGLGSGFTPSGDDFLAGFLFTLNQIIAQSKDEKLPTFQIRGSTNWASRKFVEYAQKGFVIEPLESYVHALLKGTNPQEVAHLLDTLLAVGHSSGVDASVGAVMAISYGRGKHFCDRLLQSTFCS